MVSHIFNHLRLPVAQACGRDHWQLSYLFGSMVSSSVNDGVQPHPRKRRQPAKSCQECRRRKVKCDLSEPCGHCRFSQKQCHYAHGLPEGSRNFNGRAPIVYVDVPRVPYATPPQASVSAIGPSPASDVSRLTGRAPDAQLTARPYGGIARSSTNLDHITTGPRDGRVSLNKSRLFGQSHWTNSTLEVRRARPPHTYSSTFLANVQQLQKTAAVLNSEIGNATDNEALTRLKWEIGSLQMLLNSTSISINRKRDRRPNGTLVRHSL
jgi:hypothetical protein